MQKTLVKSISGFVIAYLLFIGLLSGSLDPTIAMVSLVLLWFATRRIPV